MDVVIVESPAKAKTINKYLGSGYKVFASFGHVRDLPAKDGSVEPDNDFAMSWEVDAPAGKRLSDIAKAVKEADGLILATDPDREGEAISWHVLEVLRQKKAVGSKPVKRVVFNAITKKAVTDAMAQPRDIDQPLVEAYLARRALDYLVGFTLSPVLWRKLPGARSAGRVQSVALRLVCDRESEIERFVREEYWNIAATLATPRAETYEARLVSYEGKKLAKLDVKNGDQAGSIKAMLEGASFRALSVEAKPVKRTSGPPFTTSTLQQAASAKLGYSPNRTMQIAQKLYEGIDIGGETTGLITYMRTDGVQMAPEAIDGARRMIGSEFGERFVPEKPRYFANKAKNAQEAHEAIRPTDFFRSPKEMRKFLDDDAAKLYDLIWKRAVASQMAAAEMERTTVEIEALNGARTAGLRAVGTVVRFDGFLAAYTDHREDEDEDEDSARLPDIRSGEEQERRAIAATQHSTEPPPRYSEASLIKRMEELGIGRPSTYAATLKTLVDREYVKIDKRKLIPDSKGRVVTAFLESFFKRYVEYDFTAALEERLDEISDGKLEYKVVLRDFWKDFSAAIDDIKELRIGDVLEALNEELAPLAFPPRPDGSNPRICPKCGTGNLSLRLGKFGAFVGCSNYPECGYTKQLTAEGNGEDGENAAQGDEPKSLGADPFTGEDITVRSGRFGPYVQRGDGKEAKRASLPKGWTVASTDHEKALALLSLPRDIGQHPETGKMISAGIGRYGPYITHDGAYANVESIEDVFSIGLNRAVTVLAEKQAKGPGRGRTGTPAALKALGEHPADGQPITVRDGKYGPYVNHGKTNATLPKGKDPQSVTLEEAVAMITEKAGKAPAPKGRKAAAPKAAATKKARSGQKGNGKETGGEEACQEGLKSMARRITGGRGGAKAPLNRGEIPDRDTLLAFLRDNPGDSSKRDIAKAFGIKGEDRVILKALLRELAEEGVVRKEGSRVIAPGGLGATAVLDIFTRDKDGLLIARPTEWDDANGEAPLVIIKTNREARGPTPGIGDRVLAKIFRSDHGGYAGRILKKLDRKGGALVGVFRVLENGEFRVEPVVRRQAELVVDPEFRNGAKDGDLVEIEPVRVGRYGLSRAKVLSVAGSVKSEKAVSLIAIHMHGIPNVFPDAVITEAEKAKPATLSGREDWRKLPLITIDPADAKDHDDAVHAEPDTDKANEGGHIVTVAIADVAAYIRPGTPLDREALKRGNSTYFPDRVVPMLPERISNDLCSLRENEDRPALAVRMVFDALGKKLRHSFHRILMRSHAKVAYPQAQAAIDGAPDEKTAPIVDTILKPLWAAYKVLASARDKRMPLDLDLPERKIVLKPDGTVDKVIIPERLAAHRLIEEMMILANVATAETLEDKGQKLVYRVHDQPSLAKQEALRDFLRTLDISLARGAQLRPKDFNQILAKVRGTVNETLTNEVVLRSQSQAEYSPDNIGHFGLNLRRYAHFTSPIRRYSDLIAHRALIKALKLGDDGLTVAEEAQLDETAALISASERRSMAAERDTIDRLIANHLKDRIGETFEGRISGVVGAGLFVTLPAYGADGFVPVSTLDDDYYHFVESAHMLVGERTGLGYRLGDKVEVKLTDIQVYAGSIRYEMVTPPQKMPGLLQSFHKAKRGARRPGFGAGGRHTKGSRRR